MAEKKESLLGGFKAFLMRGNVIDLAVAVVIGAAFTNIVNSVVKGIINPVVGAFGTKDLESYASCIQGSCTTGANGEMEGIQLQWGLVLSAVLSFLITAAVVYFLMVLPMAKILAKRAAHEKAKEGVAETMEISELEVLKEIRDHLVAQRGPAAGTGTGPGSGGPGAHPTS
ncbi:MULTISPECIES: large conductance mechanosensitive channel protein MscL [unclassified Streptomyces]|uniref:large conductance mechanosensitive channel protein MscL n=1 Tax=unclassified Streptomyces TaxID=2593676 RepID=UPI0016607A8C|nr:MULTISPECIES: large conductance mechanosensitive channel protein MscL [unclassified Streptomyces]MBD0709995.1 mechanosensitive ion channel protein MscL [Streptomyces sp. CBMA291]MBD0713813.1 mechanosensitive ion channel protein MscL [Streptomyces sp. CBMA370]